MKLQKIKDFLDQLEVAIPSNAISYHRIYIDKGNLMMDLFLPDGEVLPLRLLEEDLIRDTSEFIDEIGYTVSFRNNINLEEVKGD